jgi:hypothetical protein
VEFTPLPADLLRDLLKDHKSSIEGISQVNDTEKARIRQVTCPACGNYLQPVPHHKPEVLFRGRGLVYQGMCGYCRKVTVESP